MAGRVVLPDRSPLPAAIRTREVPACPLCGKAGEVRFDHLRDVLYGAPGTWRMRRCTSTDCGLLWLDPVPVTEDLPRLYDIYYTHTAVGQPRGSVAQALDAGMRRAVLQKHLGYEMGMSPLMARLCATCSWLFPSGRDGFLLRRCFSKRRRSPPACSRSDVVAVRRS